jgi:PKD repeat protein
VISFTDLTTNGPISWSWDFGDGDTSTLQNPTHTYATTGFFTVELTAFNAHGSATETKFAYIQVLSTNGGPVPPSCKIGGMPSDGTGITLVQINDINNLSTDVGYQDFSCDHQTKVRVDSTYTIFVKTGQFPPEDVVGFIDWNNDGVFQNSEEIMNTSSAPDHFGAVTIPATAVQQTWLRMRFVSGPGFFSPPTQCNTQIGDMEDYGIMVDTTAPNGLAAVSASDLIRIRPNPSKGMIQVDMGQYDGELIYGVWNLMGQAVRSGTLKSTRTFQLDLADERSGIYLIRVRTNEGEHIEKIILQ